MQKQTPKGISVFAMTNVGMVRKNNEDSFLVGNTTSEHTNSLENIQTFSPADSSAVFMVSDGMGGAAAGEVASMQTVNAVKNSFRGKIISHESNYITTLKDSLQNANKVIREMSLKDSSLSGMGATATLASAMNTKLFIAQVGDSRAYLLRGNYITQITKDQTYVNKLVDNGEITEEEAESHPRRNVLLQAVGTHKTLKTAITTLKICLNDYLVLCSDGLSGFVKKDKIKKIINSTTSIASACKELIDLANINGGRDNITVIVAKFTDNIYMPPIENNLIDYKIDLDENIP